MQAIRNIHSKCLAKLKKRQGFTPLEKAVDLNRRSVPFKADGGIKPPSAQTVRERSSLTGFTLVEAMVTVVLFTIILGVCFMLLLSGTDSWHVNGVLLEVKQELRKGTDWMRQELIESGGSTITNVPANGTWYTTITFRTSTGVSGGTITWSADTIQYLLSGTQLLRRSGGVDKILAQNMQTLQFRRQASTPNVVEVNMQAQKTTPKGTTLTANSNFKMRLRN